MKRLLVAAIILAPAGLSVPAGAAPAAPAWSGPCHAAVDRYFPPAARARMHYVVNRESRGLPYVRNPRALGRGGRLGRASGYAQLVPGYAGPYLRAAGCSNLLDADCNIRAAAALYRTAGWRPWAVR